MKKLIGERIKTQVCLNNNEIILLQCYYCYRLKSDINGIINMLLPSNDSEECTDGLVLIVQLVTSCIR